MKFNHQGLVTIYDIKSQDDDKYNNETILSEVSVYPSVNTSTDLYKYSDANRLKLLLHAVHRDLETGLLYRVIIYIYDDKQKRLAMFRRALILPDGTLTLVSINVEDVNIFAKTRIVLYILREFMRMTTHR